MPAPVRQYFQFSGTIGFRSQGGAGASTTTAKDASKARTITPTVVGKPRKRSLIQAVTAATTRVRARISIIPMAAPGA